MSFANEIHNKHVLVFGLGLQGGGVGDALWLHAHGAVVRVTDLKTEKELSSSLAQIPAEISRTLGEHLDSDIEWADIIIKNPGVKDSHPQLQLATKLRKPVYTSIALVVREAPEKVIGITGTRGKSTTTELIYTLLDSLYPGEVQKGGNVAGTSGLALLDQLESAKYLVLELSSFQLAGFHDLHVSPHFAILTNIYPDHLNRYQGMEEYAHDKSAIYAYQGPTDYLIVNQENPLALTLTQSAPAQVTHYTASDTPSTWQINLEGEHNRENIAAVIALAGILDINIDQVKSIVKDFHALPFRLELVREVGGVKYYNDTTSTTPTATIKAIQALPGPITLIIGGATKYLIIDEMIELIASSDKVKDLIILGSASNLEFLTAIHYACPNKIHKQVTSMVEAVREASGLAKPDSIVLLSPGFASFDLFENEFDRGRQFNDCVKQLT